MLLLQPKYIIYYAATNNNLFQAQAYIFQRTRGTVSTRFVGLISFRALKFFESTGGEPLEPDIEQYEVTNYLCGIPAKQNINLPKLLG